MNIVLGFLLNRAILALSLAICGLLEFSSDIRLRTAYDTSSLPRNLRAKRKLTVI